MKATSKPRMLFGMTSLLLALSAGATDDLHDEAIKRWYPGVKQTNLVANKAEFGAQFLEPNLQNAWGIAIRPAGFGGHFWVAANGTEQSIQYVGDVGDTPLFQDDLKIVNTLGRPTGVVFNPGTQFVITQQHPNGAITNAAKFLFANINGTITGWTERPRADGGVDQPGDSVIVVDGTQRRSAFLGVGVSPAGDLLYAADFGAEPALRVYDGAFVEVSTFPNPFVKSAQPAPGDFAPFNVQTIGQPGRESVFVMYGQHVNPDPNTPLPTGGKLAEFDADGRLIAIWRDRGYLHYPWGIALAPKNFGLYSGCLLVGNFGDGKIVGFDTLNWLTSIV